MKAIFLISKAKGTAVARYSSVLPRGALPEAQVHKNLLELLQKGQSLDKWSIIQQTENGGWVELDDSGIRIINENELIEKVVTFINSVLILNPDILDESGTFRLHSQEVIRYVRELGFANLQVGFVLGRLGFTDTTLAILPEKD